MTRIFYPYRNLSASHFLWQGEVCVNGKSRLLKHDSTQTTNEYTYDAHGNMLSMTHLSNMAWDEKDQLFSAKNNTFTSYYNYDAQGVRTRKVVEKGNIIETRYYINGYEIFRKEVNNATDFERTTLNISDDEKVFVRVEKKTNEPEIVRYQYDNHLGSACLELDTAGQIISYEEYHPFGTTSYRSGRNETEVSQKRYKYCGKERDEETGLYYYGMRYYAAWLCRFVSVDPLQFKYPELTPFQYASNTPISAIDLDGLEAFYTNEGERVGQIGENTDVRLLNEGVSLEDAQQKIAQANDFYKNADLELPMNISIADYINETIEENSQSLGIAEESLKRFAGIINRETEPILGTNGGGQGSLDEKKALGGAIKNYSDKYKMTISEHVTGKGNAKTGPLLEPNSNSANVSAAFAAAIHVLSGGKDMSNGATAWDGIDQAAMTSTGGYKGYDNHQKSWGWSISDTHWKTWKGSIEKSPWGKQQLAGWNKKFQTIGFSASQETKNAKGITRAYSTATYGSTIFWKIKNR